MEAWVSFEGTRFIMGTGGKQFLSTWKNPAFCSDNFSQKKGPKDASETCQKINISGAVSVLEGLTQPQNQNWTV